MDKEKRLPFINRIWKPEINTDLFRKEKMEALKDVVGEGKYKKYLRYKRKHG